MRRALILAVCSLAVAGCGGDDDDDDGGTRKIDAGPQLNAEEYASQVDELVAPTERETPDPRAVVRKMTDGLERLTPPEKDAQANADYVAALRDLVGRSKVRGNRPAPTLGDTRVIDAGCRFAAANPNTSLRELRRQLYRMSGAAGTDFEIGVILPRKPRCGLPVRVRDKAVGVIVEVRPTERDGEWLARLAMRKGEDFPPKRDAIVVLRQLSIEVRLGKAASGEIPDSGIIPAGNVKVG